MSSRTLILCSGVTLGTVEYRVLEYAQSETQAFAYPFCVALRTTKGPAEYYATVILDEWKGLIPDEQEADLVYVEDVLYDLRQMQFVRAEESFSLFDKIANLSSGPIRTGISGECSSECLDELSERLFEKGQSQAIPCTAEYFSFILGLLPVKISTPEGF